MCDEWIRLGIFNKSSAVYELHDYIICSLAVSRLELLIILDFLSGAISI